MNRLERVESIREPFPSESDGSSKVSRPKWWPAFGRGIFAAIFVGYLWSVFTWLTTVRLEWIPMLSVGVFVGLAVRGSEPRMDRRFGITGASLALGACLLSEVVSLWITVVEQLGFLPHVLFHPEALLTIFVSQWRPLDLLVYGGAAMEGYHLAVGRTWWSRLLLPDSEDLRRKRAITAVILALILSSGLIYFNMHREIIVDLKLGPDGETLAVARSGKDTSIEDSLLLWNVTRQHGTSLKQDRVGRLAWSPDGELLAVVANPNTNTSPDPGRVSLWHVSQQHPVALLTGHRDFVTCLCFSPCGDVLATGSQDGTVKLWDVRTFTEKAILKQEAVVSSLAFSGDSRLLAVGMRDGKLAIWDMATGCELSTHRAHRGAVSSLLFTDGGTMLSAGSIDATVKTWKIAPFQEKSTFRLPMDWIVALTLSPDGKTLAVAGGSVHRPGEVKLIDPTTGQQKQSLEVYANTVRAAVFTKDGKTLIAGTAAPISPFTLRRHGEIYRWDVASGQALEPLPN